MTSNRVDGTHSAQSRSVCAYEPRRCVMCSRESHSSNDSGRSCRGLSRNLAFISYGRDQPLDSMSIEFLVEFNAFLDVKSSHFNKLGRSPYPHDGRFPDTFHSYGFWIPFAAGSTEVLATEGEGTVILALRRLLKCPPRLFCLTACFPTTGQKRKRLAAS